MRYSAKVGPFDERQGVGGFLRFRAAKPPSKTRKSGKNRQLTVTIRLMGAFRKLFIRRYLQQEHGWKSGSPEVGGVGGPLVV